jgi:hypothetical protein
VINVENVGNYAYRQAGVGMSEEVSRKGAKTRRIYFYFARIFEPHLPVGRQVGAIENIEFIDVFDCIR